MNVIRRMLLLVFCLVPLCTLVHKNEWGRWDVNREVMVAPDEFSYLLTADAILHGGHISTRETLGIDTFYPPGYPLMLAGWALVFGLTAFSSHCLNAVLLCAGVPVVYLLARRLLAVISEGEHRRFVWADVARRWMALLIAGLFATNWHVLESALYVFSEPAFMLVTFGWLALGLKWADWHLDWRKSLAVGLLAVIAWSIRGAGIVCIAVTIVYPVVALFRQLWMRQGAGTPVKRFQCILLILLLAAGYQVALMLASPNKSLASDSEGHGYPQQLRDGITKRGTLHFGEKKDWPELLERVRNLGMSHVDDYGASFVPWLREPPDAEVRNVIGKIFGGLGLLGFAFHLTRRRGGRWATCFLDVYVVFYFALYLVWPFNMLRFWSPLLPVMLVYVADGVREFWERRGVLSSQRVAGVLLGLLLLLSGVELFTQLGFYERRVNYVSDALANAARAVVKLSPDAKETTVAVQGADEHFIFAWYFPRVEGGKGFMPVSPEGKEHAEQILLRGMKAMEKDPRRRVFAIAYFSDPDYRAVFENVRKMDPALVGKFEIRRVFQSGFEASVWEVRLRSWREVY